MPKQIFSDRDKRWLDDHTQIWRYVLLRTLFFYLNGLIFIPSVAKLRAGDPFEGEFYEDTPWFNTAFHQHYRQETAQIDKWIMDNLCTQSERDLIRINKDYLDAGSKVLQKHYFEFVRKSRFAWCWFRLYRESAAMWSIYGNQGVAIRTTVSCALKALEETGREFIYGRMTYVDYQGGVSTEFSPERESDFHLLLRPFFLKRAEYKSEDEIRFVTASAERAESGGILLRNVEPRNWIQAIRLWPGLTSEEEKSLCKTIKLLLPDADCAKSDLFSQPGGFTEPIADFIEGLEKSEESSWREGKDGIPASLKQM